MVWHDPFDPTPEAQEKLAEIFGVETVEAARATYNELLYTGRTETRTDAPPTREAEVRITDPVTGGQKGQKQAQLGAIDPRGLMEMARVAGFGAEKYARFNFAKGYKWSLSFDATMRHLLLWADGQDRDEESGLHHLAHAAWHCMALMTFTFRSKGTDDRISALDKPVDKL